MLRSLALFLFDFERLFFADLLEFLLLNISLSNRSLLPCGGPGWYCADWEEPYCAEGLCDACDIHSGCTRGASFDGEAWVCNDDDGGGGGAQWDACYVHQGCLHGIFWQEGGPQGSGWYCGDGELADCDKGECDACEIRPNCDTGAIWNEDRWLWECST